jgi:hypothetical protein
MDYLGADDPLEVGAAGVRSCISIRVASHSLLVAGVVNGLVYLSFEFDSPVLTSSG